MLASIKSKVILKKILAYLEEKQKLKIIIYNRRIQSKVDINIINYKLLSGKYLVMDENEGIIKEFSLINNALLFEGKYLNKKRDGEGVEYDEKKEIIFRGEYLNGKKWNGEGYDKKFDIVYQIKDGEYEIKNDINYFFIIKKDNGEVEEYYKNLLIFQGIYLNGKRLKGKGKEFYLNDVLKFLGEYYCAKRWNGRIYNKNNDYFFELRNGKGYGKEYDYLKKEIYEGNYNNGEKNGKGKIYYIKNKSKYKIFEGEFLNGKRNGNGKEIKKR